MSPALARRDITAIGPQSVAIGGDVTGSTIIAGPVQIHWTAATAPARPEFRRYLRMLAVVAPPVVGYTEAEPPLAPLDLRAEWRRLEEAVRSAWDIVRDQGAPWAVVRLNPPTRAALADALASGDADAAYQVVHFSGHGAPNGLALEDELGRTDFVTDDQLVALFRERPVRLVVLNACETEHIAQRLHQEVNVPAVIATTDLLRDDEARLLTARLYAWLARGRSVAEAFAEALAALRHSYERGELPIPAEWAADRVAYISHRLSVPVLFGNARLELPGEPDALRLLADGLTDRDLWDVGRMVVDLAQADPKALTLLQALLVFESGATYEALRAVAAPNIDEAAFDDHLRAALDASLLEVRGEGETARYDLHPLTRAFLSKRRPPRRP